MIGTGRTVVNFSAKHMMAFGRISRPFMEGDIAFLGVESTRSRAPIGESIVQPQTLEY